MIIQLFVNYFAFVGTAFSEGSKLNEAELMQ
jgi:hypothetical protein